jgi:antitoxin FitA
MATLTLKNVPDELYAALKAAAARNRRSLNQEAISRLERATRPEALHRDPQAILESLRQFRSTLPRNYDVSIEQIDEWKRTGRQ